jgi:hypothetical protein
MKSQPWVELEPMAEKLSCDHFIPWMQKLFDRGIFTFCLHISLCFFHMLPDTLAQALTLVLNLSMKLYKNIKPGQQG